MVLEQDTYPSFVLVQPREIRPYITERLLMGRKESNQTNKGGVLFSHTVLSRFYIWHAAADQAEIGRDNAFFYLIVILRQGTTLLKEIIRSRRGEIFPLGINPICKGTQLKRTAAHFRNVSMMCVFCP